MSKQTDPAVVSVLICVVAHIQDDRQRILFERTIESLLALDTTPDIQVSVVVIDNASPIQVQNILPARLSSLLQTVRRNVNNIGAARTQGLHIALKQNHEWIAYVDSDVELPVEWLMVLIRETQVGAMRDTVGIATVNRPPHEGDFSKALDFFLGFEHLHLSSSQAIQLPSAAFEGLMKRKVTNLATCAVLLHAKALYHAGGFDADFSRVGEDLEMSYRLRKNGSLWMLSAPVALHRQDRRWGAWARRMYRYGWGQIDVARKHPEHLQTRKILPLLAGLGIVIVFLLLVLGYSAPIKLTLVAYLGFILAPIVLRGISDGKMDVAFQACWIAFVTHVAYSAGMWAGVLRISRNPIINQPGDEK